MMYKVTHLIDPVTYTVEGTPEVPDFLKVLPKNTATKLCNFLNMVYNNGVKEGMHKDIQPMAFPPEH